MIVSTKMGYRTPLDLFSSFILVDRTFISDREIGVIYFRACVFSRPVAHRPPSFSLFESLLSGINCAMFAGTTEIQQNRRF